MAINIHGMIYIAASPWTTSQLRAKMSGQIKVIKETTMTQPQTITPQQAAQQQGSALFLDVRTPVEYQEMHINGAVSHPLSDLNPNQVKDLLASKSSGVIICRSGGRARQACEKLLASGLSNVAILEGGITAWDSAGLPVVRGKKAISLERQVRIAAGALVFIGAVLGYFVNPAWIALSGFVGAGLVFAGVTDTCGMAMMLAKMPWNTKAACCKPQGATCQTKM
jgi:rhodanese-related sulfurtransferase